MSWIRVWIHLVFSTKNRTPFLNSPQIREAVYQHIQENAHKKEIFLDMINGYHEHIHCLISLNKNQSISETAQLIKGESSFWINKNNITKNRFAWQDDYWAVGVSEGHLESTRRYLFQQEAHHQKKQFDEEIADFMQKYGWQFIKS